MKQLAFHLSFKIKLSNCASHISHKVEDPMEVLKEKGEVASPSKPLWERKLTKMQNNVFLNIYDNHQNLLFDMTVYLKKH